MTVGTEGDARQSHSAVPNGKDSFRSCSVSHSDPLSSLDYTRAEDTDGERATDVRRNTDRSGPSPRYFPLRGGPERQRPALPGSPADRVPFDPTGRSGAVDERKRPQRLRVLSGDRSDDECRGRFHRLGRDREPEVASSDDPKEPTEEKIRESGGRGDGRSTVTGSPNAPIDSLERERMERPADSIPESQSQGLKRPEGMVPFE